MRNGEASPTLRWSLVLGVLAGCLKIPEIRIAYRDVPDASDLRDASDGALGDAELDAMEVRTDAALTVEVAEDTEIAPTDTAADDGELPVARDTPEFSDALDAAETGDVLACAGGEMICGDRCVAVGSDPHHCGACGRDCSTLPHVVGDRVSCSSGACVVPATACEVGYLHCTSAVTDGCETPGMTTMNCGRCGAVCGPGAPICTLLGAMYSCFTGCAEEPSILCSGVCTNLLTSASNCGSCGVACPAVTNGRSVCRASACGFTCLSGFHACAALCSDDTSPTTCGTACAPCAAPPNATATCSAGVCGFRCNVGYHLCAGSCVIDTSVMSCGASCRICATPSDGVAVCDGSSCGFVCNVGYRAEGTGCVPIAAPRLVAPLSTATVTSHRPTFRWRLAPGSDGARVEICRDRACTMVEHSLTALGETYRAPTALVRGLHFWRTRGLSGGSEGRALSATWEFFVGARSAPIDTSWGTAADFNGDGLADVVVAAPGAMSGTGRAHVYAGSVAGISVTPSVSLTGPDGFGGGFGGSLANAGDVNGDGYSDLVVGASQAVGGVGRAHLFLGSATGPSTTAAVSLTGPDGRGGTFGVVVASAGDLNGDGFADFAVSAFAHVHVYLGGATALSPSPAVSLTSADNDFGRSVRCVGDVNGDGFADLAVGAPNAASSTGRVHLYFGGASGLRSAPSASLTGPVGLNGRFGFFVASADDVNGDGFADLAVGAPYVSSSTGRAFVYLGGPSGPSSMPAVTLPGLDGMFAGFGSVASAGDTNGDGYADLTVGSGGASGAGRVYMFMGTPTGTASTPTVTLTGMDGSFSGFGSVSSPGDTNGDGLADLVVGANRAMSDAGRAYLYFGGTAGLDVVPAVTFVGPDGDGGRFGISVRNSRRWIASSCQEPGVLRFSLRGQRPLPSGS